MGRKGILIAVTRLCGRIDIFVLRWHATCPAPAVRRASVLEVNLHIDPVTSMTPVYRRALT